MGSSEGMNEVLNLEKVRGKKKERAIMLASILLFKPLEKDRDVYDYLKAPRFFLRAIFFYQILEWLVV